MIKGKALDFKDPYIKSEYTCYDKGNLISCLKCPECGYSETIYENLDTTTR